MRPFSARTEGPTNSGRPTGTALELNDVRVSFPGTPEPVLCVDRLTVPCGQSVALIGPSGAGKSTLLRLLHGLVRAESGRVEVFGRDPAVTGCDRAWRRRIGMVFQEFNLVERVSVFQNVLNGRLGWMSPLPSLLGWYSDTDRAMACQAIEETGLAEFQRQRADRLSGGQRQRVAIARVLAQDPDLIAADEPVSNLDPVLTADMLARLAAAGARRGATLLMVVHHPALAERHADRIVGMARGRIVYDSDDGAPLDAAALRTIYGRGPLPQAVVRQQGDGDGGHVAPIKLA